LTVILYELQGKKDVRFSPYCWRSRMALQHKCINAEYEPVLFSQKEKIRFSKQTLVPILQDGNQVITDSWNIACYLEKEYPEKPTLFGDKYAQSLTKQFNLWMDISIHPLLAKCIMADVLEYVVADRDKEYFRKSREKRFGVSIEKYSTRSVEDIENLHHGLKSISVTLKNQPYIAGESPSYADYILFGSYKFALLTSPRNIFPADGPIMDWANRISNLFIKEL